MLFFPFGWIQPQRTIPGACDRGRERLGFISLAYRLLGPSLPSFLLRAYPPFAPSYFRISFCGPRHNWEAEVVDIQFPASDTLLGGEKPA